jgi:hypothetical protein
MFFIIITGLFYVILQLLLAYISTDNISCITRYIRKVKVRMKENKNVYISV